MLTEALETLAWFYGASKQAVHVLYFTLVLKFLPKLFIDIFAVLYLELPTWIWQRKKKQNKKLPFLTLIAENED